jgi:hypothetical protein
MGRIPPQRRSIHTVDTGGDASPAVDTVKVEQ